MTQDTYDYVIVGAGSAGAVLAARLSEDPGATVLLLEAGGETDGADEVAIPAAFPSLFRTKWDWNYNTTEQKQLHGKRAYWPRMKALGGCSSMNAMIYIRGAHADYDSWRDQYGAEGWGYDDVLPYFLKAEDNTRLVGQVPRQRRARCTSRTAPTPTRRAPPSSRARSAPATSAPTTSTARPQVGAGQYQVTCKRGKRWSTNDAYLAPARVARQPDRRHRRAGLARRARPASAPPA